MQDPESGPFSIIVPALLNITDVPQTYWPFKKRPVKNERIPKTGVLGWVVRAHGAFFNLLDLFYMGSHYMFYVLVFSDFYLVYYLLLDNPEPLW